MSARIKRNAKILRALSRMKHRQRQEFLKGCSEDVLKALCEIALNVIKGNIRLSPRQFQKLSKSKALLRQLTHNKTSLLKKKKLLVGQKGGFLPILLAAAAPLIGELIGGLIRK